MNSQIMENVIQYYLHVYDSALRIYSQKKSEYRTANYLYLNTEPMENDAMDSEPVSGGMPKLHSVQQINNFLDVTKGLRKPKIESHFPDLKMFLLSGTMVMRKASFDELDKPKRYRLKKFLSNVKSALNAQGKK